MTNCADRRGPAFESRPDHKSAGCALTRKSAISGEIVREIRRSGFRDLVAKSHVGGLLDSGGAFSAVSVARFTKGFRRKRSPEIDQLRRLAGARV